MIYDAARVRRLCTKCQVNTSKNKNFHFGGSLLGGRWRTRDWTAVNIAMATNPNMNFGNDRSHRLEVV